MDNQVSAHLAGASTDLISRIKSIKERQRARARHERGKRDVGKREDAGSYVITRLLYSF